MATLFNNYVVVLNLSANTTNEISKLFGLSSKLTLRNPSPELKKSSKCAGFRQEVDIIPKNKKAGWNLLQLGGIIFIGIGILFVFPPLGIIIIVGSLIYYFFLQ